MKEVFRVIEIMKREGVIKDYAVTGAIGAIFYVEPFNTADIDFLINLPSSDSLLISLEPIHSWLRSRGYEIDSGGSFVVEGWPIQFVPVGSELAAEGSETRVWAVRAAGDQLASRPMPPEVVAFFLRD